MREEAREVTVTRNEPSWYIVGELLGACRNYCKVVEDKTFTAKLRELEKYVDDILYPGDGDIVDVCLVVQQEAEEHHGRA